MSKDKNGGGDGPDKYTERINKEVVGDKTANLKKEREANLAWKDKQEQGRGYSPQRPSHTYEKPNNTTAAQKVLAEKRDSAAKKSDSFRDREKGKDGPDVDH